MALACRAEQLDKKAWGLVVRPRPGGGPDQALVFTQDGGVHELEGAAGDGDCLKLGRRLASMGYVSTAQPAYDPASDAVYAEWPENAISKLDASNRVSAVPGSTGGSGDGVGAEADFTWISALTVDGQGGVWVAADDRIRRLDIRSGAVTTLGGPEAPKHVCFDLAYDPATGVVWASLGSAICRVRTEGGGGLQLVAGDWKERGSADGSGAAARFETIRALLPVSGGRLLIADGPELRCMDAGGAVTTLLPDCFPAGGCMRQMALLPSGELAAVEDYGCLYLVSGGDWASPLQQGAQPSTAATDRLLSLLAPLPALVEGAGGSGGATSPTGALTVRVGDRAFPVQRSVLAAGSEYFARLLAPGGGFEESGAAEVALPDEDPAAFAHLLSYMYGTSLGLSGASSQLLSVPLELLRPTAALAGLLLMGGAVAALTERLAAAAIPASVLSDLAWADAHGMTDLAERLRAFVVRKRKVLDPAALEEFGGRCPEQAAKLLSSRADL